MLVRPHPDQSPSRLEFGCSQSSMALRRSPHLGRWALVRMHVGLNESASRDCLTVRVILPCSQWRSSIVLRGAGHPTYAECLCRGRFQISTCCRLDLAFPRIDKGTFDDSQVFLAGVSLLGCRSGRLYWISEGGRLLCDTGHMLSQDCFVSNCFLHFHGKSLFCSFPFLLRNAVFDRQLFRLAFLSVQIRTEFGTTPREPAFRAQAAVRAASQMASVRFDEVAMWQ